MYMYTYMLYSYLTRLVLVHGVQAIEYSIRRLQIVLLD